MAFRLVESRRQAELVETSYVKCSKVSFFVSHLVVLQNTVSKTFNNEGRQRAQLCAVRAPKLFVGSGMGTGVLKRSHSRKLPRVGAEAGVYYPGVAGDRCP